MTDATDPRLETYTDAARAMESGRFDVTIPVLPADEVGELGLAIARLGHALEHKYEELRALRKVAEEVGASVLIEDVCEHIYDAFGELIPYHRLGLALLDEDGKTLRAFWARHDGGDLRINRGFAAPMEGSSLLPLMQTRTPRILNDLPAYLEAHPGSESTRQIVAEGIRSSLTCPLITQGRPVGFLFFSSRNARAYEEAHVDLFVQIAANLSAVVEKSRLYEGLLESNSLKNRLLGMAAHDMRSPLTVINGWVDMLRSGFAGELSEPALGALGHIEGASKQMLRLVEDLLDASVIDAGRLTLDLQPVELSGHLRHHLESARLLAAAKGIELATDLAAGPAWVEADANRLRQVLDNLLSNAIKFSPSTSTVSIWLEPRGDRWAIRVRDRGPGIPEEELESLFGAFERASVRPTAGERSIGLGLAITRRVVEAHGGRIDVESEVGRGSTFTVELPARPTPG